jgi:dihydrofolate synthase/folylpolyglutamate synthase
MIDSREGAIAWLDDHIGRGIRLGLDRMRDLMAVLGDPQADYDVIHVAGTNGKTTVARVASSVLVAHGLRVGTTVSPHLERIEERTMLDLEPASPEEFVQSVSDLAAFVDLFEAKHDSVPTYFELTTALAFSHFATHAVDVGVIEVGMGGRLDATNVADGEVAVVTSIARDHMEWLGDTLEKIAVEKLAIAKEGSTLVTGPLPEVVVPIAQARASELGIPHRAWDRDFAIKDARLAIGGWSVDIAGVHADYDEVYLPLHGRHQVGNAVLGLVAVEELFGRALDPEAVIEGWTNASSPGRIEVVGRSPLTILDGAHNPSGLEALTATLDEEFGDRRFHVVMAAMGDKELDEMVRHLEGVAERCTVTTVDDPRAIAPEALAEVVRSSLDIPVDVEPDPHAAVANAVEGAAAGEGVLVTGSLYLVGDVRPRLLGLG